MKSLFLNVAILTPIKVVIALSAFLITFVSSNSLNISDFGLFMLLIALINTCSIIGRFGSDILLLKNTSIAIAVGDYKLITVTLFRAISYYVIATILFSFLIYSMSLFDEKYNIFNSLDLIYFITIWFLSIGMCTLIASIMQGFGMQIKSAFALNGVMNTTLILLIYLNDPLGLRQAIHFGYISAILALSYSVIILINIFRERGLRLFHSFFDYFKVNELSDERYSFKSSKYFWLISIMSQITLVGSQFIASYYLENDNFSLLMAAYRVSLIVGFSLIIVNLIVSPRFASAYHKNDIAQLNKVYIISNRILLLFGMISFLLILFLGESLLNILGDYYVKAHSLLLILSLGQLVNVATGSVSHLLMMTGFEKDLFKINLMSGISTVILSIVLLEFYGAIGSAIAAALGMAFSNIFTLFAVRNRLGFTTIYRVAHFNE